jgi:hypothetical protein
MNECRYPAKSLIGDYIRSGVGLAIGLGVLGSAPSSPTVVIIFGGLVVLFLVFGFRTVQRQLLRVAVTNEEICRAGLGTHVMPWGALERLKLRFYGTRRQRTRESNGGFMHLTLEGAGASMTLDSSLTGFEYIAWRATKAARENGISLDSASASNLLELGIDADADQPAPQLDTALDL